VGVIVLGMHRSGTSAVTRVIDLLGPRVGEPLMPPKDDNPAGFWEVEPLMHLNDEVLAHLGGAWDDPPLLAPGWEHAGDLDGLRARAADMFHACHPREPWVWKDPRACVLLPFWFSVLGRDHVAVVVLRDPEPIVRSLVTRNALSPEVALRAWERSMRAVLRDTEGLPMLVVRYDDLLDRGPSLVESLQGFLRRHSLPADGDVDAALASVRGDLRHAATPTTRIPDEATDAQRALLVTLDRLVGTHEPFVGVGADGSAP
jgi:hypothetical protein